MRGSRWRLGSGPSLFGGVVVLVGLVFAVFWVLLQWQWYGKILPRISITSIPVGGLAPQDALVRLQEQAEAFLAQPVEITFEERRWALSGNEIGLKYELEAVVDAAYRYGRRDRALGLPSLFTAVSADVSLPLPYVYEEEVLEASFSAIAATLDLPSVSPAVRLPSSEDPSQIVVDPGEPGRRVDISSLRRVVQERLASLSLEPVPLPVAALSTPPSPAALSLTKLRAERLFAKRLILSYVEDEGEKERSWELSQADLLGFLDFDGGFDQEKIASYAALLVESVDRPPRNAMFAFREGRVVEFAAHRDGLRLDVAKAAEAIGRGLLSLEGSETDTVSVPLPVEVVPPEIKVSDINSLGIRELLGRGESTFRGSIANRQYNIALAGSRISGILIPPGEVFSFNAQVGEISAASGYRPAYVIREGRTILDDGGGVCQVSTTLFRAVLKAGLPIVERRAHSYRVGYYEQNEKPGFDATVFSPSVDFQFRNDTPGHVLIQVVVDKAASRLVVELYGTADGRTASVANYRLWDVIPPPPDLYVDDPTLPAGSLRQVDWKASGGKVKFDYRVERDGETLFEKSFYSAYRPWQSVFLRGTGG